MHKLMILFHQPENVLVFEDRWSNEFVPKAEKMPGIRRVAVSRIIGSPDEETDLHLVHEFFFDDLEALQAAMTSEQGQEAGRTLMSISFGFVRLCYAKHLEEDRPGEEDRTVG